jgi:hypothetical protein
MRRRELDFVRPRPEEGARRLSIARRDTRRVAGRQVERIDLVERIAGLAFALKDKLFAVR